VASICNLLGKNSTETALVLSFSAHVQVWISTTTLNTVLYLSGRSFKSLFSGSSQSFSHFTESGASRSLGATCGLW
jgi:hypothetical protein